MGKRSRKKSTRDVATSPATSRASGARAVPARSSRVVRVPNRDLRKDVAILNAITAQKRGIEVAERTLTKYVRQARRYGVTWTVIGAALGITQQAASHRWGPYPEGKPKPGRKPRPPQMPDVCEVQTSFDDLEGLAQN